MRLLRLTVPGVITLSLALSQKVAADTPGCAARLASAAQERLSAMEAVTRFNAIGTQCESEHVPNTAKQAYRRAIDTANSGAAQGESVVLSYNNLAALLNSDRDYAAAESQLRIGSTLLDKWELQNSAVAPTLLGNLAYAVDREGRHADADPIYQHAVAELRRQNRDKTLAFAKTEVGWGLCKLELGQYESAIKMSMDAYQLEDALPNVPDLDKATPLNNAGFSYIRLGNLLQAEDYLNRAAELERPWPDGKQKLAETVNNLATIQKRRGNLQRSRDMEDEALTICLETANPDPVFVATVMNNLGTLAGEQNHLSEAEKYYRRALERWTEAGTRGDAGRADTIANIAFIYSKKGHHKQAQAELEKSVAMVETEFGRDHPRVTEKLCNLAAEYFYQKKYAEALNLYRRAEESQTAALGAADPITRATWRSMAIVFASMADWQNAEIAYRQALPGPEAARDSGDHSLVPILREYASVLRKEEKFGQAEEAETRALGIEVREKVRLEKSGNVLGRTSMFADKR